MVTLSSQPNKSIASLALATTPATKLMTPSAKVPPMLPCSSPIPRYPLTAAGRPSWPWNAKCKITRVDGRVLRLHFRRDPAVESCGGGHACQKRSQATSQALSPTHLWSVPAPPPARSAGGRVAPAEEHDGHDANVFGKEAESCPRTQKVPDDAVPAVDFGLAHEGTQTTNVETIHCRVAVPYDVCGKNWNEEGEQYGVDLRGLRVRRV